ncbi:hypothetical protein DY000_02055417 [Brassica cretica]|uniref:Galectin domain-containing protein n=1 Tax=Brassica cretica TaxID=69181 RepID=A0ABQ7A8M6_BRACR|nr:hypothetical protein DY000_02055417 [Brassica cretica]
MKKPKLENSASQTRFGLVHSLIALLLFYFLCISFQIPSGSDDVSSFDALPRQMLVGTETNRALVGEEEGNKPGRVNRVGHAQLRSPEHKVRDFKTVSELFSNESFFAAGDEFSIFHKTVKHAISTGKKMWDGLDSGLVTKPDETNPRNEKCPDMVSVNGPEFVNRSKVLVLPCGLTLGSQVTVVATPHWAHAEKGDKTVMVTQFMMELQGLKAVEGEDPPRILHFNPRIRGDWSGRSVIEQNTCYRMQWGSALRCDGRESSDEEEDSEHKQFIGLVVYHWLFFLSQGFVLEDATGLAVKGNIDVHSIYASSLPFTNPSFAPQKHLEMQSIWKAPALLPEKPVELFIGILSAGNHFAERMAVRKSWMQHKLVRSSKVVARFFVALHARKEVNVDLKKEADYFGDIVIVPYMDHYDLVVLKTVAICEYGEWPEEYYPPYANGPGYILSYDIAKFIVDDFEQQRLRLFKMEDVSMGMWVEKFNETRPVAVEWPEDYYPPYANGPGYILSYDIAKFIVDDFEHQWLRLFKMEDVSMGIWVEKFNETRPVAVVHSLRFCQLGCIEDYFTAHYQSPRQMICLWDKLQRLGRPQCCNMR